jgi:hypothetical protein
MGALRKQLAHVEPVLAFPQKKSFDPWEQVAVFRAERADFIDFTCEYRFRNFF